MQLKLIDSCKLCKVICTNNRRLIGCVYHLKGVDNEWKTKESLTLQNVISKRVCYKRVTVTKQVITHWRACHLSLLASNQGSSHANFGPAISDPLGFDFVLNIFWNASRPSSTFDQHSGRLSQHWVLRSHLSACGLRVHHLPMFWSFDATANQRNHRLSC